jgi:hypothetical protein
MTRDCCGGRLLEAPCLFFWTLFLALGAIPAHAQSLDSLRQKFRLAVPPKASGILVAPRSSPAMGASSPSAFGGSLGDVWLGATWIQRPRFSRGNDGVASAGFGAGDPYRLVGLDVDIISFTTIREGFGKRMALDLELHRYLGDDFAVAVGWESVVTRGFQDTGASHYATVSRWIQLRPDDSAPFSAVLLTAGLGDGRFRSEQDEFNNVKTVNVFGSLGVRVLGPASVIADWTGQDLYLGASFAPLKRWQLVISSGFADVTRNAGDGPRFVVSGGLSFNALGR